MANRRDIIIRKDRLRKTEADDTGTAPWEEPSRAEERAARRERRRAERQAQKAARQAEKQTKSRDDAADDKKADDAETKPARRRKRRRGRSALILVVRLVLVVLLVAGGVWAVRHWDEISPDGLLIWFDDLFGGHRGDGYPLVMTGSEVRQMGETSEGLVVVTDTSYRMFNASGGEVVNRSHGLSDPSLATAGKWALLYDVGANRLRRESRAGTDGTISTQGAIVSAAVNAKGMVAVVTDSTLGYMSEVTVYDRRQKEVYHWYSSELYVMDAALSADGKTVAVIGAASREGYLRSSLLIFRLDKEEPVARYDDEGVLWERVNCFDDGTVAVMGDTGLRVVNETGTVDRSLSFQADTPVGYAADDVFCGVVTRVYGTPNDYELIAVDTTGEVKYRYTFRGVFRDMEIVDDRLTVLADGQLYTADKTGKVTTQEVIRDGNRLASFKNSTLVLGLTSLEQY